MTTDAVQTLDWEARRAPPALAPDEIHLWWQDLHDPCLDIEYLHGLLSERERQRVARLRVARVAREFTAARAILKRLLGAYLGCAPHSLAFRYGPLGKPALVALPGGRELCFNYTDAGGFALYAFAWNRELGVDLERRSRELDCRRIIERRFAPGEAAALLALPEPARRRAFLACWTRKEAYGKALGVGIRYPFDSREMWPDDGATPLILEDHIDGAAWTLHQLYPDTDFVAALVHPAGTMAWRCLRLPAS